MEAEAEAVAEIEAEASEVEEAETEVEVEVSVDHQEEDSNTTPTAHPTVKCCEHFERHFVAESKYNNITHLLFLVACCCLVA